MFVIQPFDRWSLFLFRIVYFYRLSYLYYSAQALLIVFVFGILFSFIAYKAKWVERKPLERKLWVNKDLYKKKDEEPQPESVSTIQLPLEALFLSEISRCFSTFQNELQVVAIVTTNKVHPADNDEKAEAIAKDFFGTEQPSNDDQTDTVDF